MFRCYYAPFRDLSSPTGEPTKATCAFSQMLLSLIREKKPTHLAMVIDLAGKKTFRDEIYADYKANREPPPEDFAPQEKRILQIVEAVLRAAGSWWMMPEEARRFLAEIDKMCRAEDPRRAGAYQSLRCVVLRAPWVCADAVWGTQGLPDHRVGCVAGSVAGRLPGNSMRISHGCGRFNGSVPPTLALGLARFVYMGSPVIMFWTR
jgi:hypothetical protein